MRLALGVREPRDRHRPGTRRDNDGRIAARRRGAADGEAEFEVDLTLEGDAKVGAEVLFAFELTYAGVFRVRNIPQDQLHPIIMIECPRLLFPFARQIVAEAVRNGGFPPLYIDPIDFVGLYRQEVMEAQAAGEGTGAPLAS